MQTDVEEKPASSATRDYHQSMPNHPMYIVLLHYELLDTVIASQIYDFITNFNDASKYYMAIWEHPTQ